MSGSPPSGELSGPSCRSTIAASRAVASSSLMPASPWTSKSIVPAYEILVVTPAVS